MCYWYGWNNLQLHLRDALNNLYKDQAMRATAITSTRVLTIIYLVLNILPCCCLFQMKRQQQDLNKRRIVIVNVLYLSAYNFTRMIDVLF